MICRHLWISGRVQGVWFRQSTAQRAEAIGGLLGWVRNLPDGRVEVWVQGELEAVQQLVDFCHQGPPLARVDQVEEKPELPDDDCGAFAVRR